MSQWYYAKGGQQLGPVDEAQLRQLLGQGVIGRTDLVWREGMSQWEPASVVLPDAMPGHMLSPLAGTPGAMPGQPETLGYFNQMQSGRPRYAGFWWRFLAVVIDGILLAVVGMIVQVPIHLMFGLTWAGADPTPTVTPSTAVFTAGIVNFVISTAMGWLYEALLTSSKYQGTLGKMACGLRVTRADLSPVSFARASGRHFAKFLSGIILAIGYIMAAFTDKKQALHDIIADTCVLKS